jgi:hypothetical protein
MIDYFDMIYLLRLTKFSCGDNVGVVCIIAFWTQRKSPSQSQN